MKTDQSQALLQRALRVIPGGVSSPVRAFKSVGGQPIFIARGEGAHVIDADGQRYLDFVGSWGPLILGHAAPVITEALARAARDGTSFGAATQREVELAERVVAAVDSVERVRFVSSGTEATMSALRLARGFTGRAKLIKFAGCYHGHGDAFLAEAGSGIATLGIAGSPGVPEGAARDTVTVPFNNLDAVQAVLSEIGDDVAAIILEPIACNMGMVEPAAGFLAGLRRLCDEHGALLIFDEVITGFRVGLGGAQAMFGIKPDLSTFGKGIGGGLPVGAYGGRADIMAKIAPEGPVYQAGTLSGNPLAMAAGIATLDTLAAAGFYDGLDKLGAALAQRLAPILTKHNRPARLSRVGSIFHLWFKADADAAPRDYEEIKRADAPRFGRFFSALLQGGVYIAPSAFEVGFLNAAHTDADIDTVVGAMDAALAA